MGFRIQGDFVIVTVNGCFDVLHAGHVRFLKRARDRGDCLIVLLNSDESVKRLKGKDRPINKLQDRIDMLTELRCVDRVYVFTEDTPLNLLNLLKPDLHVKSAKSIRKKVDEEKKVVEAHGGRVVFVPIEKGYSSSKIIKKVRK